MDETPSDDKDKMIVCRGSEKYSLALILETVLLKNVTQQGKLVPQLQHQPFEVRQRGCNAMQSKFQKMNICVYVNQMLINIMQSFRIIEQFL